MQLKSISYAQHEGKPEEWSMTDFSFGDINLIVGKNATGKTKTLNIIKVLASLVSGEGKLVYNSGNYKLIFGKDRQKLTYVLQYEDKEVIKEQLLIGSDVRLDRGPGGEGTIYVVKEKRDMEFQTPPSKLACVYKRDNVQHPFFEDLHKWGKSLRHYFFGTALGKDHFAVFKQEEEEEELNLKNTEQTVAIFRKGEKKYSKEFVDKVKADMLEIGFGIDSISIGPPESITFIGPFDQPQGILLSESDLKGTTDQNSMSQGMFRALSLIIQMNYSLLASVPSCILIDDIGEGLDYERSSSLIKLLMNKAKNSHVQLIMTTNDRFVMNTVPLKYWSIMKRFANESKIYNSRNAKKQFEDFELTGLNNFDLFTSGSFEERCSKE